MPHILAADDDQSMLALFEKIFSFEPDFTVDVWGSKFDELAESYDWANCDLALVDQYLGPILGADLLAWLADVHPKVHRVMFTGDVSITTNHVNAELVLHKPLGVDDFLEAIWAILRQ